MRPAFTAPVVFMSILAGFRVLASLWYLSSMNRYLEGHYPATVLLSTFSVPALFFAEAFLYWRLRYRNIYYTSTWTHCLVLLLGTLLPLFFIIPTIMHASPYGTLGSTTTLRLLRFRLALFWIPVFLAHIFLVRVIVLCYTRQPPPHEPSSPDNILDDFA